MERWQPIRKLFKSLRVAVNSPRQEGRQAGRRAGILGMRQINEGKQAGRQVRNETGIRVDFGRILSEDDPSVIDKAIRSNRQAGRTGRRADGQVE